MIGFGHWVDHYEKKQSGVDGKIHNLMIGCFHITFGKLKI